MSDVLHSRAPLTLILPAPLLPRGEKGESGRSDALSARASGAHAGETPALPGGASRARGRDAGAPRRCDDDRARGRDAGAPRRRQPRTRARRPRSQAAPASTAIHVGRPRLRSPRNAPTRGEGGVRGVLMRRCPSSPLPPSPTVSGDALGARASGAQAGETPALPGDALGTRASGAHVVQSCCTPLRASRL